MNNPIFATYTLECTHPGCNGRRKVDQAHSAGLKHGDMVPEDPGEFEFGRCPKCRRTKMKVVEAPKSADPPKPKGFTKIPKE